MSSGVLHFIFKSHFLLSALSLNVLTRLLRLCVVFCNLSVLVTNRHLIFVCSITFELADFLNFRPRSNRFHFARLSGRRIKGLVPIQPPAYSDEPSGNLIYHHLKKPARQPKCSWCGTSFPGVRSLSWITYVTDMDLWAFFRSWISKRRKTVRAAG